MLNLVSNMYRRPAQCAWRAERGRQPSVAWMKLLRQPAYRVAMSDDDRKETTDERNAFFRAWFVREVLPLEAPLTRFLRRNWREMAEIPDLRQEVYARALQAAKRNRPLQVKPFVFAIARNLIIDRVRRARIVSIDATADLEALNVSLDEAPVDQQVSARQQLRRLQGALDRLPPRCRTVFVLRKIEGLSQRETAHRMGLSEDVVEKQVAYGLRILADLVLGEGIEGVPLAKRARDPGSNGTNGNEH